MKIQLEILRRSSAEEKPVWQVIPYETADESATVASALQDINANPGQRDREGRPVSPVRGECSGLQKKCGACAMVIGGKPRLACDTFLREFAKKGRVTIEPLRKFPVIADLMVDRSAMRSHLKEMQLWMNQTAKTDGKQQADAYEASRCLQCGCCLEVCPEYAPDGDFYGAAAFVPGTREMISEDRDSRKALDAAYRKYIFRGCGKSLACKEICPAGIDTDRMLSRSNAIAVWRRSR